MHAIIASKGLTNRPVILPDGTGSYVVKEGNRRIVALRKIRESMAEGKELNFIEKRNVVQAGNQVSS
jgi:hypothetical protein